MQQTVDRKNRLIDEIDRKIIHILSRDPQCSIRKIAQEVEISAANASGRIDKLIEDRLITIAIQRDIRSAGYNSVALAEITADFDVYIDLAERIGEHPDIISVSVYPDDPQIVAFMAYRDTEHLLDLYANVIGAQPGVRKVDLSSSLKMLVLKPGLADL
jgi:DNA-binding Lrp family transcriptional regulator